MKSHWVTHKDVRVFISDFSGLESDADAVQAEADGIIQSLSAEPPNSVRAITNVEHTYANERIIRVLMNTVSITNQYVRVRAVIGVHGFRKHFVAAFTRLTGRAQFHVVDTLEQALDWIVQQ